MEISMEIHSQGTNAKIVRRQRVNRKKGERGEEKTSREFREK